MIEDVLERIIPSGISDILYGDLVDVISTAYAGSATARDMFDVLWQQDKYLYLLPTRNSFDTWAATRGGFEVFVNEEFMWNNLYIDTTGEAKFDSYLGAILHECVHAILGKTDPSEVLGNDYAAGETVLETNKMLEELGIPGQLSYFLYDPYGYLIHGFDYSIGRNVTGGRIAHDGYVDAMQWEANGDWLLIGTPDDGFIIGRDELYGGDGNDTIWGLSGADTIYGGNGDDFISGGAGDDKIYDFGGSDIIEGGAGNDTIYGYVGSDSLNGDGRDATSFDAENDYDILTYEQLGRSLSVHWLGEEGVDLGIYGIEPDGVWGDAIHGFEEIRLTVLEDFVFVSAGLLALSPESNPVVIDGYGGDNVLFGDRTAVVSDFRFTADARFAVIDDVSYEMGTDTLLNFRNYAGTDGVDIFSFETLSSASYGLDYVTGESNLAFGQRIIPIAAYADQAFEEFCFYDDIIDLTLYDAGGGSVRVSLDDSLTSGNTNDGFIEANGARVQADNFGAVLGSEGTDLVSGTAFTDYLFGFGGDDTLVGGGKTDLLVGDEGADILYGGNWSGLDDAGTDALDYEDDGFTDELYGGAGFDTYYVSDRDSITDATIYAVDEAHAAGERFYAEGKGKVFFNGIEMRDPERVLPEHWSDYLPPQHLGIATEAQLDVYVDHENALVYRVMNGIVGSKNNENTVSTYILIVEDRNAEEAISIVGVAYNRETHKLGEIAESGAAPQNIQLQSYALSSLSPNNTTEAVFLSDLLAPKEEGAGPARLVSPFSQLGRVELTGEVAGNGETRVKDSASTAGTYIRVNGTTSYTLSEGALAKHVLKDASGPDSRSTLTLANMSASSTDGNFLGMSSFEESLSQDTDGDDTLRGGKNDDVLIAGEGNDILKGGGGNDILEGGWGSDELVGGNGIDAADYARSNAGVYVNLTTGAGSGGHAQGDTFNGIENLAGSGLGDDLHGDAGDNVITGRGGDDYLEGHGGTDVFDGGSGNDAVGFAWDNSSTVYVDLGAGIFEGLAAGHTYISIESFGGTNNLFSGDTLIGSEGDNHLFGFDGDDVLIGRGGNDYLSGGVGTDTIDGGDGDDWIEGGGSGDLLTGGAGRDIFVYTSGNSGIQDWATDTITDFVQGTDLLDLTAVDADRTNGDFNANPNDLFRWISTDGFYGFAGELRYEQVEADTCVEGDTDGDGVADFRIRLTGTFDLGLADFLSGTINKVGPPAPDVGSEGTEGDDELYGTDSADYILGLGGIDVIYGRGGDDRLEGGEDDDLIYGGQGVDRLYGNAGDDRLIGESGGDLLYGGDGNDSLFGEMRFDRVGSTSFTNTPGNDSLYGEGGDDKLYNDPGTDYFDGGDGIDTLYAMDQDRSNYDAWITLDLRTGQLTHQDGTVESFVNIERFVTGTGNDIFYGDEGANWFDPYQGADIVWAGAGDDYVLDESGSIDEYHGGDGIDTIDMSDDTSRDATFNLAAGTVEYSDGSVEIVESFENVYAGWGADVLYGTDSWNVLKGGLGNDTLYGLDGDDILDGGQDDDILYGGAGNDLLRGGEFFHWASGDGVDHYDGGEGIDTLDYSAATWNATIDLFGGFVDFGYYVEVAVDLENAYSGLGNDTLIGTSGNNVLSGGAGNDLLTGNAGADTFVFGADGSVDEVQDFVVGEDILDLTAWDLSGMGDLNITERTDTGGMPIGGLIVEGGGQSLRLAGLDASDISSIEANSFIFV